MYGESARILLCHWHVLKYWKNIQKKVKVQSGVRRANSEVTTRRNQALLKLMKMLNARDEDTNNSVYVDLKEWCESDVEILDCNDLLVHFDREYLNKKELWSSAWRQTPTWFSVCPWLLWMVIAKAARTGSWQRRMNHANINTNNYVESWHRCLKEVYLESSKTQRMDALVYILWNLMLPDVMTDHAKTMNGLQVRRTNKSEDDRINLAKQYTLEGAPVMICNHTATTIEVKSFSHPDLININQQNNSMVSCTCADHMLHSHNSSLLNNQNYDPDSASVINALAEQLSGITASLRRHKKSNVNRQHQHRFI
ncbi:hypothetical protein BC941DRAFT_477166 [Chlamydoabsidia padenii]|nr:hypothetical protein BC941DRAFT_477166 [Chlamydoabsidia padenii]